jgi:hypothetical protein
MLHVKRLSGIIEASRSRGVNMSSFFAFRVESNSSLKNHTTALHGKKRRAVVTSLILTIRWLLPRPASFYVPQQAKDGLSYASR